MKLSIIIPVLNEADGLPSFIDRLMFLRISSTEVIVVDGGSKDASTQVASRDGIQVIQAERGRARQMNAGAAIAHGDVLLFLHADTALPPFADQLIKGALALNGRVWGRFDVRINGRPFMLRVIGHLMNWRSRLTGIATGDQAIFVTRSAFESVDGFPDQPLMEDIELSKRLLMLSRPICLADQVITSGRRWEAHGVWRTIFIMWRLRWAYWRGVPASELAKIYR
ncbi:TIGR04283 family arsenosugar biosynthesis glycosyltransferase [Candidatus Nitrotoga sp. 1052]|uniref:TIGR04283 family arsenosugar biosynthesis glycosyltransferase n=1 Tax=Candidatus Nitrotoga sp. 1052 TaxID=2886964 RepID=UPI001EF63838|nr:TIGR04283 family arsenosugar biosynthesis glycosyltransferase [Candidatus Nitrotoga sp. 1052]CAH1080152.1 Glycosyl transferase [Candidatus Nitrotoga sp. 1052]